MENKNLLCVERKLKLQMYNNFQIDKIKKTNKITTKYIGTRTSCNICITIKAEEKYLNSPMQ